MPIHLQTSNKTSLHSAFTGYLSKLKYSSKRDHELRIISCYIEFDAIKELIKSVKNKIRVKEVSLAFEYFESFRGRRPNETVNDLNKLKKWCSKLGIKFRWYAVRDGALMHAKGYAVIQNLRGKLDNGIVCIGSGNATSPGLGTNLRPNVELAYISHESKDVFSFIEMWNRLEQKSRSLDEASAQADEYGFAYSLLASGVFLHEWQDNFRSQVGITYTLTPEGKKVISVEEELKQLGFDVEQATINRNPLDKIDYSFSRALPKNFGKIYTIDTRIGRWCPLSVWSVVEDLLERDENFENFRKSFLAGTQPKKIEKAIQQECLDAEMLIKRGLIIDTPGRIERWKEKVESLRKPDNKGKLKRIFLKFDKFELPYDFSERDEVEELFDSLLESISIKSNRSVISKKIEAVEEERNLSLLALSEKEKLDLNKLIASQK